MRKRQSKIIRHEPAASVVKLLGGRDVVAALCGLNVASVSKWYMGGKYGYGGRIPVDYHDLILSHAKANGIPINRVTLLPLADQHANIGVVRLSKDDGTFVVVTSTPAT